MRHRTSTSTAVALGVLAAGFVAVASVQAQWATGATAQERLMTQQRILSRQRLQDGSGTSGVAVQQRSQQRQRLQSQPRASQGIGISSGAGSGPRMTRGGRR